MQNLQDGAAREREKLDGFPIRSGGEAFNVMEGARGKRHPNERHIPRFTQGRDA